ncbi:nuclear transport factor 2 family protein [Pseudonocardia sp. DSM 110487]|uniref:nuclear transport factor 2 family protein n=1 Tax=Pseudonocardia sp. DSM 110487 TaxID=2865833 RepID=UPI001C696650|nr:nuclear transport factor 2 family protein [Pseudonocardia sp. DSM 110487]QYN33563.1 nuclear transport factor 2 family protein [Pseudonocardia sp. DSM 110487]
MTTVDTTGPLAVARRYFDALAAKDFATVASMFADDIVWHQPGTNRFSGTHRGSAAVGEMIGGMMAVSEGAFELSTTAVPMVNGTLVAVPVHFTGKRDGAAMAQDGLDLLRIEGDRIAEVWLFSSDPWSEDAFWGAG